MVTWTREGIAELKEDDLSRDVLVPLFAAMGYQDVRFSGGGVLEQGKDLIMYRAEPVRARTNIAVIVKAVPITGKIITGDVINQLREAFGQEYLDPTTGERQRVHEALVVTPHAITKEGTYTLHGLVANEPFRDRVDYVDGTSLWNFIDKHLGARALLPRLLETYRRVRDIAPGVAIELSGKTLTMKPAAASEAPPVIVTPTFGESPEDASLKHEFERFLKTGEAVELPARSFEDLPIPEFLGALGLSLEDGRIRLGSAGHVLAGAMTLTSRKNESVTFDNIELVLRGGTEQLRLTNEAQGIPFTFNIAINLQTNPPIGQITYASNVVGWSAQWLNKQQKALQIMASGCTLWFRDHLTGIEHGLGTAARGMAKAPNAVFQELVREVAWIEQQTKEPIVVPERLFFTARDRENLDIVRSVLNTGQVAVRDVNFTIEAEPEHIATLVTALRTGDAETIGFNDGAWPVLDTLVPLGPAEIHGIGSRLVPVLPLDVAITAVERGDPVAVRIEPGKGKRLFIRYTTWYKRGRM